MINLTVQYLIIIFTTIFYATVSFTNFLNCLTLSLAICGLNGENFTLKNRRLNLLILAFVYLVCLISFINQGVCNVWSKGCPYFDRKTPFNLTNDVKFTSQQAELTLGLILLLGNGISFVLNAFMMMKAINMLHITSDGSVKYPISPLRRKTREMQNVENNYGMGECLICKIAFTPTDRVHVLACRHIFHADCFSQWYTKGQNCPICRNVVVNSDDFEVETRDIDFNL